jgi:hypothetical protein
MVSFDFTYGGTRAACASAEVLPAGQYALIAAYDYFSDSESVATWLQLTVSLTPTMCGV